MTQREWGSPRPAALEGGGSFVPGRPIVGIAATALTRARAAAPETRMVLVTGSEPPASRLTPEALPFSSSRPLSQARRCPGEGVCPCFPALLGHGLLCSPCRSPPLGSQSQRLLGEGD